jgi:hypothetical protein
MTGYTMERKGSRMRKNGVSGSGSLVRQLALAALGVQSVSAGFIDMDTPLDKRTTTSFVDGSVYHLVSQH